MGNIKTAALNSLGVLVYVSIVAYIMHNGEKIFGKVDSTIGSIGILMLFVLSVGVVAALVVGKSLMLYLDNKKKEAVSLLITTLACLLVLTAAVLLYLGLK